MADVAEGGGAALPPKRPTIIRPGRAGPTGDTEANGSPQPTAPAKPAPARPAPPPPAGGPGRPPPVDRPLPPAPGGRPPPPVPGRPAPSTEGHPPVPHRPTPATPPPLRPAPAVDKKKTNRNSVHGGEKKRLEITIVSARPMSEVGFRSEASTDKPDPPAPAPTPKPSVPEPVTSQHSAKPPRPASISRPPPPLSLLTPAPASKTPPVPSPRSSVPPRTEVPSPRLPPPQALPPPVPTARPHASPQDHYESVPDSSPVYAEPDENVESKPSRGPPPTSQPPPVPASEARPSGLCDAGMEKEEGEGVGMGIEAPSQSRPKRPTIIRHGRPQRPSASSDKTDSEKPVRNSPSPPSAKKDTATEPAKKEAEAEDNGHRLPFKPKLRPTVVGRAASEETPATSDSGSGAGPNHILVNNEVEYAVINKPVKDKSAVPVPKKPEVLLMPGEGEPPPIPPPLKPSRAPKDEEPSSPPPKPKPAPKPKPSILPKPKPAGGASEEQDGGLMLGVTGHVREPEEEDVGSILEKPAPSLPARKPTVIRKVTKTESESAAEESNKPSGSAFPPKPVRTPAVGKDSEEEGGHAPPPRRPPSFIGQRKGSQPEAPPAAVDEESSAVAESGAGSDHSPHAATRRLPPPKPRPVRPSSVAGPLSHTEKPSRPEEAAEEAKTPEAPPHRPPRGALPLPGMPSAAHEEPALRSRPPRPSGRPKSVAVFPPPDTSSQLEAAPSPRAAQLVAELQKDAEDLPQQTKPEGPPRPEKIPGRPPPPSKSTPTPSKAAPPPSKSAPPPKQNRSAPSRPAGRKAGGKAASEGLPLPARPGPSHPLYHYTLCHPHAIAQHDFCTSQPGELPLKEGEVVVLLRRSNPEWLVGRVGHVEGMFPQNFVEVIHPLHDEVNLVQEVAAASASPFPALRRKVEVTSGPRCEARFDFEGTNRGDLIFEEGDIIRLLERVGAEWLKGELGGVQGIFPASFVEIVEDLPSVPHAEDMTDGGGGNVVKAVFDFEGLKDELSFQAGQKVEVVGRVSEDWLVGRIGEHKGKFPATFVDRVPSDLPLLTPAPSDSDNQSTSALGLPSDASSSSSHDSPRLADRQAEQSGTALARVVALYDFTSDQDGDLTFKEGDTISVLEFMEGDWLRGRMDGREGVFPKSFVDLGDFDSATAVGAPPSPFTPLGRARALYDFAGQDSSELSFKEGDIITLGDFPPGNTEWRRGEVGGHTGLFPMAFVKNLD